LKQSVVPDPTHDERRRLSAADLQRLAEAKDWTIATFCGGAAEFDLFGDRRADCGDMRAIDNMLERLQLVWSEDN
jgi:hypothetical protein